MNKTKINLLFAGACLTVPFAVLAGPATSHVDGFYVPYLKIDADESKVDDGDGWGVKGNFQFADQAFFTAEYQSNTYEDIGISDELFDTDSIDFELEFVRAGIGFVPYGSPFYGRAEYVHVDSQFEGADNYGDDGYGLHLGVRGDLAPQLSGYAEGGYVDLGDFGDGFQGTAGLAFDITPQFGLFAEYRYIDLEDEGFEASLSEARTGVRLLFGM